MSRLFTEKTGDCVKIVALGGGSGAELLGFVHYIFKLQESLQLKETEHQSKKMKMEMTPQIDITIIDYMESWMKVIRDYEVFFISSFLFLFFLE